MKSLKTRNYKVFVEPRFQPSVGLRKPDILAIRESENAAFVVDHTVVWDNGDLSRQADDKERYYCIENIKRRICRLHPATTDICFYGLVVSARGVWGRRNDKLWNDLGLPAKLKSDIMMSYYFAWVSKVLPIFHAGINTFLR